MPVGRKILKQKISQITCDTKHRPWEIPKAKWFWYQEWNDAVFLHYKVEKSFLRLYVPAHLELDSYENSYWVSLVAFKMDKIQTRYTMEIPYLSNFHEVNVRTYVKYQNRPGVFFLSIEAGKRFPTLLARLFSQLPYKYSNILKANNRYSLKSPGKFISLNYKILDKITSPGEEDLWLTERYCLYKNSPDRMRRLEIHHRPWDLYQVKLQEIEIQYQEFGNLIDFSSPLLCHYSPGVKVIAWKELRS